MTDTEKLTRLSIIAGALATAGTMVWQLSGIAHDVQEVKESVAEMRVDDKAKDNRLNALEGRVTRLETSVSLMGEQHGKASSSPP